MKVVKKSSTKINKNLNYEKWKKGYGVIKHSKKTIVNVAKMVDELKNIKGDGVDPYDLLHAADILANASMWLCVHAVYAKDIFLDGRKLNSKNFKKDPQGHLGAVLNMIPAYVGYLTINALTGITRSWIMGQGHATSAIDSINLFVNNMNQMHKNRYSITESGLTKFVRDFYSYKLTKDGKQDSPLGSHVNPITGGGYLEGGYLGFASLQYPHIPLSGENLVAFLSDGAFEEQRGSDWSTHWWRKKDCGMISPIMIYNKRRIDQRTMLNQEGNVKYFEKHLKLYGFDPIIFDGSDPSAFCWSIFEQEKRLKEYSKNPNISKIKIPYGIALSDKGYPFYNYGTNYAHNLPLVKNPRHDETARNIFNKNVKKLYIEKDIIKKASKKFQKHKNRPQEKDSSIINRKVSLKKIPKMPIKEILNDRLDIKDWEYISPMQAIDEGFLNIIKANPHLRPRVGSPDEMLSNRMGKTLEQLKFRVKNPEKNSNEDLYGNVISALNEESVSAACFGNKGGINLIATYEAFGSKMFGQARQEITFSKHQKELNNPAKWLSIPIILTSNTWENSKNELSHQDPSMCESMLGESSDISRVLFVPDFNTASEVIKEVYKTQGQIWSIVIPKNPSPLIFMEYEAKELVKNGAIRIKWSEYLEEKAEIALVAIGSYQLIEILKASNRLRENKIPHIVIYIIEPGKFRSYFEENLIPNKIKHVILVTHTRIEIMIGMLNPLFKSLNLKAHGFINRGGTLDVFGMLYINQCTYMHILKNIPDMIGLDKSKLLNQEEF